MSVKIDTMIGNDITSVTKEAKKLSKEANDVVEFDFNDIKCLVNENTNVDNLVRDYMNAWTMEWKVIGPDCQKEYDKKTQLELDRRNKKKLEEREERQRQYEEEERIQKEELNRKIGNIEIKLKDVDGWNSSRKANQDSYGGATLNYAENWAKLMQYEINNGKTVVQCADSTSREADVEGITGFMYGCAVNILSKTWIYGEELRKWHNKDYGHEGEGTVNPSIVTIN